MAPMISLNSSNGTEQKYSHKNNNKKRIALLATCPCDADARGTTVDDEEIKAGQKTMGLELNY